MTGRSLLALAAGVIGCAPGEGSDLVIRDAFGFAPVSTAEAAVYFTVENRSAAPDTLLGLTAPIANAAMIHEGMADGGLPLMDPVKGLAIPAQATVALRPGGLHTMLVGLARLPLPGDTIQLTLRFARGGERTVAVPLIAYGDAPPPEG